MNKIKILIVEDDLDWLRLMTCFLNNEHDFIIVGTASNKEDALQLVKTEDIDVILMDINLSENNYDGIYAASEICQIKKVKVIMLTSLIEHETITQSFTAGAVNFIHKTRFQEIPAAIRLAVHPFSPIEVLLKDYHRLKHEEELKPLTQSEREVFELVEKGYTRSQMEQKLFKSESTLKNQVNSMLKKLGVKSSKEAIEKVHKRGIFRKI
ncbi:MAG: DNA-binding response regulator [Bacilli bacterium]|nr:DNA-binding response regulator [Bacilli bacterium]